VTVAAPAFSRTEPGWRLRLESVPIERLRGLGIAAGLTATTGALHAVNLTHSPALGDGEGLVVARTWAATELGRLAPATYLYDQPPLGWLQVSLWARLTDAFGRAPDAVAAGREAMLVAFVASAVLLWVLARRLGLSRWAAALALGLFGFSPLAVALHRQVSLENVAVPWILAAFALAATPRRRLGPYASSGALLAVAALSCGSAILVAPALALALWRAVPADRRGYVIAVAGALFAAVAGAFVAYAALRGQLSGDGPSLLGGLGDRFADLPSTGSVFSGGSAGNDTVTEWLGLDLLGPLLGLAAALFALARLPRLAPEAVAFLVLVAAVVRPGHLQPTLATLLLPFGALLVAGAAERLVEGDPAARAASADRPGLPTTGAVATRVRGPGPVPADPRDRQGRRRTLTPPAAALLAAGAVVAVTWAGDARALARDDGTADRRDAEDWLLANRPAGRRVLLDAAMWADLAHAGTPLDEMVLHPSDDEPEADADRVLDAWPRDGVVVSSPATRAAAAADVRLQALAEGSVAVAVFGRGDDAVEVRAVGPDADTDSARRRDPLRATEAGAALSRNAGVRTTPSARRLLADGRVDERVMTTLVAVGAQQPVHVDDFPADPAEVTAGEPRRAVRLRALDDRADAVADIASLLTDQEPPYRPADISVGADGWLTVTWAVTALS
jgi:hypothetical protein